MRIIFFGTSQIAVSALEALLKRHEVAAVVTAADKKKGRGQKLQAQPVKLLAEKLSLRVLQPEYLTEGGLIQSLEGMQADLFAVCSYGKILPKRILQIPRIYTINLHMSLLPKYRGAGPINWAVINGEQKTGVTIFKMNEYMDQGEIILQREQHILDSDTSASLSNKLALLGSDTLLAAIDLIERDKASLITQDESEATLAPKLKKKDGLIDWSRSALEIHNRIRGLQPWPGAFSYFKGKLLKIWQSELVPAGRERKAGEIIKVDKKEGVVVQAGKDGLLLKSVQLEGRKKMSAVKFIAGRKLKIGEKLGQ